MLKLAYTDVGIFLEQLPETVDQAIERRWALAQRTGHQVQLEESFASMVIPHALPELPQLECAIANYAQEEVGICASLAEGIEIILRGSWLTYQPGADEGLFFVDLDPHLERLLANIWAQIGTYMMSCTWPHPQNRG